MSFHYRYRKQIRIGIIILLLIGSIISFSVYKFQTSKKERPKTIDSIKVKKENTLLEHQWPVTNGNFWHISSEMAE